jgi:hypothetical protein
VTVPIHVEQLTNEVTVMDGGLPFTESQLDQLAELVATRLERRDRDTRQSEEATTLRRRVAPALGLQEPRA